MSKFTDFLNLFMWDSAEDSEEEFNIEIPDRKIRGLQTVGDIVKFIEEN